MISVSFLLLVGILLIFVRYFLGRRNSPPGPMGVPIFGSSFSMGYWSYQAKHKQFFNYLLYLAKNYGNLVSVQLGQQKYVILNSIDVVKEAYLQNGDIFSGRPTNAFFKLISTEHGVVSIDGEKWKNQRRFCIHTLRDFGLGKKSMENAIIEEADYIAKLIEIKKSQPICTSEVMVKGVSNVISVLLFNKRWDYNDTKLIEYIKALKAFTNFGIALLLPIFFPFLAKRWIMMNLPGMSSLMKNYDIMKKIIQGEIDSHVENFQKDSEPKDLVETFLQEKFSLDEKYGVGSHDFDMLQCNALCWDLFSAGVDTTTNILSWDIYMLSTHPDVQNKFIQEIDEMVPIGKTPSMADKKNLIYVQAVLDEVHRYCIVTPLLVARRVTQQMKFQGYEIFPDDLVVVNVTNVHRDPNVFEDPLVFRPERFIGPDGSYKPIDNVIPFGLGKRQCLGESLARMENLLILVYLMQRYRVEIAPEDASRHEEIWNGCDGLIHSPANHKVIFKSRH